MMGSPLRGSVTSRIAQIKKPPPILPQITTSKILVNTGDQKNTESSRSMYTMTADLSMMSEIKIKMDTIMRMANKMIKENTATPEIGMTFKPLFEQLMKTYEIFNRNGMQYFIQYQKIKSSAKTNQVLSSAFCRIPIQNFKTDWELAVKTIDKYEAQHPPPHSKEIMTKFKAINSALDTIKIANDTRKNPNIILSRCIGSIEMLGDKLANSIIELFSQPSFPHFETDLFEAFKTDIRAFRKVMSNAFANEFLQAGVPTPVLIRIKSNIFSDCQLITESLKGAFAFPDQIGEIKKIKDLLEISLHNAITKLSVPFVVISPSNDEVEKQRGQPPPTLAEVAAREKAEEERRKINDFNEATKTVKDFLNTIDGVFPNFSKSVNPFTDLQRLGPMFVELKENSDHKSQRISQQRIQMKEDIVMFKERSQIMEHKVVDLSNIKKDQDIKIANLESQIIQRDKKIKDLENTLKDKEDSLGELTAYGDPSEIRDSLKIIIRDFEKTLNFQQTAQFDDNTKDDYLVLKFVEILNEVQKLKESELSAIQGIQKFQERCGRIKTALEMDENTDPDNIEQKLKDNRAETMLKINTMKAELDKITKMSANSLNISDYSEITSAEQIVKLLCQKLSDVLNKDVNIKDDLDQTKSNTANILKEISSQITSITYDKAGTSIRELSEINGDDLIQKLTEIVSKQLNDLSSFVVEIQRKADELRDQISIDHKKFEDALKRIAAVAHVPVKSTESLMERINDVVNGIIQIEEPYAKKVDCIMERLGNITVTANMIKFRLLGLCPYIEKNTEDEQIDDQNDDQKEESLEETLETIKILSFKCQDIIDKAQRETFRIRPDFNTMKGCLESIYVTLSRILPNYNNDVRKITVEQLCQTIQNMVDNIAEPAFSELFISTETIKNWIHPAMSKINSKVSRNELTPSEAIPILVQDYLDICNSMDALTPFCNLASDAVRIADSSKSDNNDSYSRQLSSAISLMKSELEHISSYVRPPSLLTCLFSLVSLLDLIPGPYD